eukprot:CAMPEP_0181308316 /NCGR_PEP_ID=MMETSP1101-20121128/11397_1 /TAXON_ID=46948 /ORGANISM="Rhodomonas abbreviata, Strain Caron Lab Isolate" /LENGTH=249 /DNA_ID=CAMNT_0023414689 /DNA_START=216 /DNA_END=962 /DNA_ORIENTATION=-
MIDVPSDTWRDSLPKEPSPTALEADMGSFPVLPGLSTQLQPTDSSNRISLPPLVCDGQDGNSLIASMPRILLKESNKSAFTFRQDGLAVLNSKIFMKGAEVHEKGSPKFGQRIGAAMGKQKHKIQMEDGMRSVFQQVLDEQRRLPPVGSTVVVKLKKPFVGLRAEAIVKFIGTVPKLGSGIFVGVELFDALGDHDGMGYFHSRLSDSSGLHYGTFIRGWQVEFADNVSKGMRNEYRVCRLVRTTTDRRW